MSVKTGCQEFVAGCYEYVTQATIYQSTAQPQLGYRGGDGTPHPSELVLAHLGKSWGAKGEATQWTSGSPILCRNCFSISFAVRGDLTVSILIVVPPVSVN